MHTLKNGNRYGKPDGSTCYLLIEHPLNRHEELRGPIAKEMFMEWKLLWKLVETDPILNKNTKWMTSQEIDAFIVKHKLIDAKNAYHEPAPVPVNNNNFNLSGDEARLILTTLLSESVKYSGNMLPMLLSLVQRLNEININQPPK